MWLKALTISLVAGTMLGAPDRGVAAAPEANMVVAVAGAGFQRDIAIGPDGLPFVGYSGGTVHCGNVTCTSGNMTSYLGGGGMVEIGTDGLPSIAYLDPGNDVFDQSELKVIHCGEAACGAGNTTSPTIASTYGTLASMAVGADGYSIITYTDLTLTPEGVGPAYLLLTHCGNGSCTSGNTTIVLDNDGDVGGRSSIAIGSDGLPIISYGVGTPHYHLRVLHCGVPDCAAGNLVTMVDGAGSVGGATSIAIGTDGMPVISYEDYANGTALKVAHCGNSACTSANTITNVGPPATWNGGIAIGSDGLPIIKTGPNTSILHCGDAACSSGNALTTVNDEGGGNGLAIGSDGLPLLGFVYTAQVSLHTLPVAAWVLHCGTLTCEDTDGDGDGNSADLDDDGDGCADVREEQEDIGSEVIGGLRNPYYLGDFFDVPGGPSFVRDGAVAGTDFFALLSRFGATGDPFSFKPQSPPPPAPAYHLAFDRGPVINFGDPWDLLPANGSVSGTDFFSMLAQFGHDCS